MHRGLSFVSMVAITGLLLNASVIGFAQDQTRQDDTDINDDSDAFEGSLDDSDPSEAQPAAMPGENEPAQQAPGEIEQSDRSEQGSEPQSAQLESEARGSAAVAVPTDSLSEINTEVKEDVTAPPGQIALEIGTFFRSDSFADTYEFAPILSLWFGITDAVDFVLEAGCAYAGSSNEAGEQPNHFYLGNPFVAIRRAYRADRTSFHFGFGVTVPVSSLEMPADPFEEMTYQIASAMRGRWNHWLWMPEHIALVIPIGARMVSEENILFGGELGLAVVIPTGDYHDYRGDFYAQGAGEIGFGFETVETGLRLQAVLIPLIPDEDKFQSSVGPFVKLIMDGGFVGANVMVNLDAAEGVFGKADRWGFNLKGGVDF